MQVLNGTGPGVLRSRRPLSLPFSETKRKKAECVLSYHFRVLYFVVAGLAIFYTIMYSVIDHPENFISLGGIVLFVCCLFVTSTNRRRVCVWSYQLVHFWLNIKILA